MKPFGMRVGAARRFAGLALVWLATGQGDAGEEATRPEAMAGKSIARLVERGLVLGAARVAATAELREAAAREVRTMGIQPAPSAFLAAQTAALAEERWDDVACLDALILALFANPAPTATALRAAHPLALPGAVHDYLAKRVEVTRSVSWDPETPEFQRAVADVRQLIDALPGERLDLSDDFGETSLNLATMALRDQHGAVAGRAIRIVAGMTWEAVFLCFLPTADGWVYAGKILCVQARGDDPSIRCIRFAGECFAIVVNGWSMAGSGAFEDAWHLLEPRTGQSRPVLSALKHSTDYLEAATETAGVTMPTLGWRVDSTIRLLEHPEPPAVQYAYEIEYTVSASGASVARPTRTRGFAWQAKTRQFAPLPALTTASDSELERRFGYSSLAEFRRHHGQDLARFAQETQANLDWIRQILEAPADNE